MSDDLKSILVVVGGGVGFLFSLFAICGISGYYSNQQKLECVERMMDKSATDILAVCGKISS
jgi:hypothetical protein